MKGWSHPKAVLVDVAFQWSERAKNRAEDCCRTEVSDRVVFFLITAARGEHLAGEKLHKNL